MRIKTIPKGILSIMIMFWSVLSLAQTHNLPSPEMASDPGGQPPPPGLVVPIDMGIPGLIIGGLLMGFYFRKKD